MSHFDIFSVMAYMWAFKRTKWFIKLRTGIKWQEYFFLRQRINITDEIVTIVPKVLNYLYEYICVRSDVGNSAQYKHNISLYVWHSTLFIQEGRLQTFRLEAEVLQNVLFWSSLLTLQSMYVGMVSSSLSYKLICSK